MTELYPDCKEAHSLMALAAYDRGWHKKALPMFRKAFALGEREVSFLTDYAAAAMDNLEHEETGRISWEILKNGTWSRGNIECAIEAYSRLGHCARTRDDALELMDSYGESLAKHKRLPLDPYHLMAPFAGLFSIRPKFMEDFRICRKADADLEKTGNIAPENKLVKLFRGRIAASALQADGRIQNTAWHGFAEMAFCAKLEENSRDEAEMIRFGTLDAQLCLMKEPEQFQRDVSIVREDYPFFYESQRDFIERASSEGRDALWERLKRQFFKAGIQVRRLQFP